MILALTYGTAAALTAETKSAAVVPVNVAVTDVDVVAEPGTDAMILNVLPTTNGPGVSSDPVIIVAPDENCSYISSPDSSGVLPYGFNLAHVVPTGMFIPPPTGSNA